MFLISSILTDVKTLDFAFGEKEMSDKEIEDTRMATFVFDPKDDKFLNQPPLTTYLAGQIFFYPREAIRWSFNLPKLGYTISICSNYSGGQWNETKALHCKTNLAGTGFDFYENNTLEFYTNYKEFPEAQRFIQFYVNIEENTSRSSWEGLMLSGIHMEEFTWYNQSNQTADIFDYPRLYDVNTQVWLYYFQGAADKENTTIKFHTEKNLTIYLQYMAFLPNKHQFLYLRSQLNFTKGTTTINVYDERCKLYPGHLFFWIENNLGEFNISFHESYTHQHVYDGNTLTYQQPIFPFVEAFSMKRYSIKKEAVANIKSLSIIAYSQNPSLFKDAIINIGNKVFPYLTTYEANGTKSFTPSLVSAINGVANFPADQLICNETHCDVYITMHMRTEFYMESDNTALYTPINITVIVTQNIVEIKNPSLPVQYSLNKERGKIDFVVNTNLLRGIVATNTKSVGYGFSNYHGCSPSSTKINVLQETKFQALSLYGKDKFEQNIVTDQTQTRQYYEPDAMYFITTEVRDIEQVCDGELQVHNVYESSWNNQTNVGNFAQKQLYFYTNMRGRSQFSACLAINSTKRPDIKNDSFQIYGSSKHVFPNKNDKEYEISQITQDGDTLYFCINGVKAKTDITYFSVVFDKFSSFSNVSALFRVGDQHADAFPVLAKHIVSRVFFKDRKIHLRILPSYANISGTSSLVRKQVLHFRVNQSIQQIAVVQLFDSSNEKLIQSFAVNPRFSEFTFEFSGPIDRQIYVDFGFINKDETPLQLTVYHDNIYKDDEILLFNSSQTTIFQFDITQFNQKSVLFKMLTNQNYVLGNTSYLGVCKNKPMLSHDDPFRDKSCFLHYFSNESKIDSFSLTSESFLTMKNLEKDQSLGAFFISVFSLNSKYNVQIVAEIVSGYKLLLNEPNALQIRKQSLNGLVNYSVNNWFVFDIFAHARVLDLDNSSNYMKSNLYINFSSKVQSVCIQKNKIVDIESFKINKSLCLNSATDTDFIEIKQIMLENYSHFYVMIEIENYGDLVSAFPIMYHPLKASKIQSLESIPFMLESFYNYENSGQLLFEIEVTKNIEYVAHVLPQYSSSNDFRTSFEGGSRDQAQLLLSFDLFPTVQNSLIDLQSNILSLQINTTDHQKLYLRIVSEKLLKETLFLFVFKPVVVENSVQELTFGQEIIIKKNQKTLFFRTLSNPMYLLVESCEPKINADLYISYFDTQPSQTSFVSNEKLSGTKNLQFPDPQLNKKIYSNINSFFAVANQKEADFSCFISSFAGKPLIPKDQHMVISAKGDKFTLLFRSARPPIPNEVDGEIYFGYKNNTKHDLLYQVYAIQTELQSFQLSSCFLRKYGFKVHEQYVAYDSEKQSELNFAFINYNASTHFALLVKDEFLGHSSAYEPVGWNEVSVVNKVATWVIVVGVIGGLVLVALIIVGGFLIAKFRKPQLYRNLYDEQA